MTDMVERVARAISEKLEQEMAAQFGYFSPSINEEGEETGRIRIDGEFDPKELARAAIESMRKPTDDMVAATGNGECSRWARGAWDLMIDSALKEKADG